MSRQLPLPLARASLSSARRFLATNAAAQPAGPPALESRFSKVPLGPPDAILGITEAFNRDHNPRKINLGVGAYRDAAGSPFVLPCVREAQLRIAQRDLPMEYLPVSGSAPFVQQALALAYGPACPHLRGGLVAGIQALSGTGACRMAGELMARWMDAGKGSQNRSRPLILMPDPTWANHLAIFRDAGCEVGSYAYYDPKTKSVNVDSMLGDLEQAPEGAAVLLHATAHNPTGCDPTMEQWREISDVCRRRSLQVVFDSAYQGFTSGSAEEDAASVRQFVADGHKIILAQSFSKNLGLYGHRVGAVSIVCESPEERAAVESQLKILARAMWSNPPVAGVRIAEEVFGDPALEKQWHVDLRTMAGRIKSMRTGLKDALAAVGSKHDWGHIVQQNGMFTFSGLSPAAVEELAGKWSVYLTKNGRISMAGVYENNVQYLAEAMHAVTKQEP